MRKFTILCCFLLLVPALALRVGAQDSAKTPEAKPPEPPAHYYHLEYVVQELGTDGKPANSRTYSTIVGTERHEQFSAIRTGSRVPIVTGALHTPVSNPNGDSKLEYQYQYVDVGVNIDTQNVHEIGHQLAIDLKADISALAESGPSTASGLVNDPVIRQNSWQASVLIPIGKPTVVFSSDALDSKGSMHFVVTATALQ
jgi:hypothetical protein